MATEAQSLHMKSSDLIKREPLDYGGFGEVYLCYHATLGQVVLKTVYTGPLRSEDHRKSLLEEGSIMASLNHERVVKLLGVIMEDRDCSLVIELLPRGNLLVMLEAVCVPMSIKGRIILEILEGMVYLTERQVIHKDIKPENILVDKDFHIKIADLGLATCQTWSKLTKQESRRRSQKEPSAGARGAGTLSYMAPEHLESIHTRSTEKSDVYSFAIVVWVILTGQEPYENARSEDHMIQCVRQGDRPAEDAIPDDSPAEIIELMKRCWAHNPAERPTFKEAYNSFLPFYKEKLEPNVENDICILKKEYEGPEELVEKMKSFSVTPESWLMTEHDGPGPLVSTERSMGVPVEASIEDLHQIQCQPSEGCLQSDARGMVEEKLHREFQYHKYGSYNCGIQSETPSHTNKKSLNPFHDINLAVSDASVRPPAQETSSVQSWNKAEALQEGFTSDLYSSLHTPQSSKPKLHPSVSTSSLLLSNQQHPDSHLSRQQSCPTYPLFDTFSSPQSSSLQDPGSLYIKNASGIQIGNNNTLHIGGFESPSSLLCSQDSAMPTIQECILKYESHRVRDEHLELVRVNIGNKWKRCARGLGLRDVEIETIEHDYQRDGLPEMVHQMIAHWRMKQGSLGCTIGTLCRALEGNVKVDVIKKILDLCGSSL